MEFKIKIQDEAHSKKVQEYLFERGYEWDCGITEIKNTHKPWIVFNAKIETMFASERDDHLAIDLSNLPEFQPVKKYVKYLNVYRDGSNDVIFAEHETKEIADNQARSERIACIRVEFEEGRFDD